MKIAVASGKGGTGKTTIALALAYYFSNTGKQVDLYDCDVEEPNVDLFLKSTITESAKAVVNIPAVNIDECNSCGKCEKICEFNAIVLFNKKPLVFPDLCHSCGGCSLVCPTGAISEIEKPIGETIEGSKENIFYTGGRLMISEPMSPPLIKQVKKFVNNSHVSIFDSPPGTSCPAVTTIHDSQYVIVVTEPTPFGLHDMKLLIEFLVQIQIPFGVVINRSDIGNNDVVNFCEKSGIDILAEIPHSIDIAKSYAKGDFIELFFNEHKERLNAIVQTINSVVKEDAV